MSWHRKHLLDIESLSAEEITTVLDTAREFKAVGERDIKKVPALQGKTVVNFFVEPSTRTRISFELSAKRLSADIINFAADASSFKKGESLKDTARNLEALNADIIVIRHSAAGAPHFLARFLKAHVVNAGDGAHEHPTQALLDLMTMRRHIGDLAGAKVVSKATGPSWRSSPLDAGACTVSQASARQSLTHSLTPGATPSIYCRAYASLTAARKVSNCSSVSMVKVNPLFLVFSLPQALIGMTVPKLSRSAFSASGDWTLV